MKSYLHTFKNVLLKMWRVLARKKDSHPLWVQETIDIILNDMKSPPVLYCEVVKRHDESLQSFHNRMVDSLRKWDSENLRTDGHLESAKSNFFQGFIGDFSTRVGVMYDLIPNSDMST